MAQHVSTVGTLLLKTLCGSRAYGLNDADSDYDYHGVYIVPTRDILSIGDRVKETAWIESESEDNTAWELGHFLKLALNCNPTVLETFVAPIEEYYTTDTGSNLGRSIQNLFPYVVSRDRVYHAFRGYASNQRKKMFEPQAEPENKVRRQKKAAVAYLRSLYHGMVLLQYGKYNPLIEDDYIKRSLLTIRNRDTISLSHVVALAEELEGHITEAYEKSDMREKPDVDAINRFLLEMRELFW